MAVNRGGGGGGGGLPNRDFIVQFLWHDLSHISRSEIGSIALNV